MSLHIGIVACSTEGAALCYRTISLAVQRHHSVCVHRSLDVHGGLGHRLGGSWELESAGMGKRSFPPLRLYALTELMRRFKLQGLSWGIFMRIFCQQPNAIRGGESVVESDGAVEKAKNAFPTAP